MNFGLWEIYHAAGMIQIQMGRNDVPDIVRRKAQFGDFYYLPEGGTNDLALRGTAEIVGEIETQLNGIAPDFICVPCGTGGTIAGIISAAAHTTHILGFSALQANTS